MKGLRKVLTPFAPDQSGAASVLYDLGGILVICDAGGCAGNICGFDEPRWTAGPGAKKSAIFSAGLRDMDAILGRDKRLVEKLALAAGRIEANFAAVIGTPVPAVIATDYAALCRMAEKETGLPVFSVACSGMRHYDKGMEEALVALFSKLSQPVTGVEPGRLGVLGASPLELSSLGEGEQIRRELLAQGWGKVSLYGMGASFEEVRTAGAAEKNLVLSPAGAAAAKLLQERFGTPWEAGFPLKAGLPKTIACKKTLVVQQQVRGNALREQLLAAGASQVRCASWFMQQREWMQEGDFPLKEEDDFTAAAADYQVIFADESLRPLLPPGWRGEFVPSPHFAVSGKQVVA